VVSHKFISFSAVQMYDLSYIHLNAEVFKAKVDWIKLSGKVTGYRII